MNNFRSRIEHECSDIRVILMPILDTPVNTVMMSGKMIMINTETDQLLKLAKTRYHD
jgi:hypothetical protein